MLDFALLFFCFAIAAGFFVVVLLLWRIAMVDLPTLNAKIAVLSTNVDALLALPPATVDLQPAADAVDAANAKVAAALTAAGQTPAV